MEGIPLKRSRRSLCENISNRDIIGFVHGKEKGFVSVKGNLSKEDEVIKLIKKDKFNLFRFMSQNDLLKWLVEPVKEE